MEPEAVHLDDQALRPPEEVDLVTADAHVEVRLRERSCPDQRE